MLNVLNMQTRNNSTKLKHTHPEKIENINFESMDLSYIPISKNNAK